MSEVPNSQNKIFPIPGINSNVIKGTKMFHIQTEVIPGKKLVLTQIYDRGKIIYSDFISFKKHYEELITTNPLKLRDGIKKLVKLLHQKGLKYLKDLSLEEEINSRTFFLKWLQKTYDSIKNDYSDAQLSIFFYDENTKIISPIYTNIKSDTSSHIAMTTAVLVEKVTKRFSIRPLLTSLETNNSRLFLVSPKELFSGIFSFDKNFSLGLAKLEIKRYLPLISTFFNSIGEKQ